MATYTKPLYKDDVAEKNACLIPTQYCSGHYHSSSLSLEIDVYNYGLHIAVHILLPRELAFKEAIHK